MCQAKDDSQPFRLSDKKGTVFTYSMDYLAGTTDTPLVITVVNFEGGGRMLCMMTDRELEEGSDRNAGGDEFPEAADCEWDT